MRARPLPRTFRSGELAPWLDGITNEITLQGCRTLENFIVRKQGQALRRPGTFFVNEVKDSADATILVPITIDDDNSYVLEIGDAYIRFYKNHARITYAGTTTIYEVTSPWSTGDVSDLRWTYMPDKKLLYFTHPNYSMRKLVWTSDASWELSNVEIFSGMFYIVLDDIGNMLRTDDFDIWNIEKLTFSNNSARLIKGKNNYIAIGQSLACYISNNGSDWTPITLPFNPILTSYYKSLEANNRGEVIYIGHSTGEISYSWDDGLTWTVAAAPSNRDYRSIAYNPNTGYWRISSQGGDGYSNNSGKTWTSVVVGGINNWSMAVDKNTDLWLGCGVGGIRYASSVTGTWVTGLSVAVPNYFYGLIKSNTRWLAIGSNTDTWSLLLYTSSNGMSWTEVVNSGINAEGNTNWYPRAMAWIHHTFIIHASQHFGSYHKSPDTIVWTSVTLATNIHNQMANVVFDDNEDYEFFDLADHYPKTIVAHEGRLILGAINTEPATLWGSKTGKFENFYLGEFANEGWSYKLSGERNVDIQWIMGNMGGLVVGTRTAEGIMLGSQEEGITPQTAQFRWLSTFGSANIQPVRSNNYIIFVQRGKEIVRGYVPQAGAYESPELTCFADHICKGGILSIDRQEDPQNIIYFVRADGQLPALSFEKELIAWSRIKTASTSLSVGIIESIAAIPTTGAEDEVWQIVNRKVAAGTVRYIEYYDQLAVSSLADAHYVDCGVNPTSSVTFQTIGALTHLAGEVIDALVDGTRWISGLTVAAGGTITVSPYSGTNIHAGLPYASYLQTMRGDYGSPWGDGAGLNKRTSDLLVWVHDSTALAKFGPTTTLATETIAYSTSTALITDVVKVNFPGQWDRDNYIWCIVIDPRPFTLVAMIPDSETGSR